MTEDFLTEGIKYLTWLDLVLPSSFGPSTPPPVRRLWAIHGVGNTEKATALNYGQLLRLPGEEILVGLHREKIPLTYQIYHQPGKLDIRLGTSASTLDSADKRQSIIESVLHSLYPTIDMSNAEIQLPQLPLGGIAVGLPSIRAIDSQDPALPIDRLNRALPDAHWAILVLAEPALDQIAMERRFGILEALGEAQAIARGRHDIHDPIVEHFFSLHKDLLESSTIGQAIGAWRTQIYIFGDSISYHPLKAVLNSVFASGHSIIEPFKIADSPEAFKLARDWAMPHSISYKQQTRSYRRPYEYQTWLTSRDLGKLIHLPSQETNGFKISSVPVFSVIPASVTEQFKFTLGLVMHYKRITKIPFELGLYSLIRHVLITGQPRKGKTTTTNTIIDGVDDHGIPFWIFDPAKAEYRALLNHPRIGKRLQIFTLGEETISQFRLNPLEVPLGISVGLHIDLIKMAICGSFGMWEPLPELLERCFHEVYADYGWDTATNTNYRIDQGVDRASTFPTLSDLIAKVEQVTQELDYRSEEVKGNIRAALLARLQSLRVGAKGRMLDCQYSIPIETLLEQPVIFELEHLSHDDDKAFVMMLLLIRLYEALRVAGPSKTLRLLLVIDEAHRLLKSVPRRSSHEEGDPRGQAVELFTNMLAEVAAYGLGFLIIDQVITKLDPDVVKQTGTKIIHSIVDAPDRAVVAGAIGLTEQQSSWLINLPVGQAVVFSDGNEAPLLVQVPILSHLQHLKLPDDQQVAAYMASSPVHQEYKKAFLLHPLCGHICQRQAIGCHTANRQSEQSTFQQVFARVVLSAIEDTDALDRLWPNLIALARAKCPPGVANEEFKRCLLLHTARRHAERRGAQSGWSYTQTTMFTEKLCQVLVAMLDGTTLEPARSDFQAFAHQLYVRQDAPYPMCDRICKQEPKVCLYRHAAADLITAGQLTTEWGNADEHDRNEPEAGRQETWKVCLDAADRLMECPSDYDELSEIQREAMLASRDRAGLCFAQQMLVDHSTKLMETTRFVMKKLLAKGGESYE